MAVIVMSLGYLWAGMAIMDGCIYRINDKKYS
uniref:Uncharacterized protein n=1 Tax=Setaria italica TaxID=4555 RepID=K3Y494_SETIT